MSKYNLRKLVQYHIGPCAFVYYSKGQWHLKYSTKPEAKSIKIGKNQEAAVDYLIEMMENEKDQ